METFPLGKVRKIMDFWNELGLPYEEREKRVRSEGDKEAQLALENLMQGKVNINKTQESSNADPQTLDRFLGLGIDPKMLVTNLKND
jgi:hypothetical protein